MAVLDVQFPGQVTQFLADAVDNLKPHLVHFFGREEAVVGRQTGWRLLHRQGWPWHLERGLQGPALEDVSAQRVQLTNAERRFAFSILAEFEPVRESKAPHWFGIACK